MDVDENEEYTTAGWQHLDHHHLIDRMTNLEIEEQIKQKRTDQLQSIITQQVVGEQHSVAVVQQQNGTASSSSSIFITSQQGQNQGHPLAVDQQPQQQYSNATTAIAQTNQPIIVGGFVNNNIPTLQTIRDWFCLQMARTTVRPAHNYTYCVKITPLKGIWVHNVSVCDAFRKHIMDEIRQRGGACGIDAAIVEDILQSGPIHWLPKEAMGYMARCAYNASMHVSGHNIEAMTKFYQMLHRVMVNDDGMWFDCRRLTITIATVATELPE